MHDKKLQVFQDLTMDILKAEEIVSPEYLALELCTRELYISADEAKEVLETLRQQEQLETDDTG